MRAFIKLELVYFYVKRLFVWTEKICYTFRRLFVINRLCLGKFLHQSCSLYFLFNTCFDFGFGRITRGNSFKPLQGLVWPTSKLHLCVNYMSWTYVSITLLGLQSCISKQSYYTSFELTFLKLVVKEMASISILVLCSKIFVVQYYITVSRFSRIFVLFLQLYIPL